MSTRRDFRSMLAVPGLMMAAEPALQDALWAKQVRVRAQNDERGVRLSAHMYVSPADVDRALAVVRDVGRKAA